MAVSGKTARRLLKFLLTTDPPAIHEQMELLANQLDNDVEGGQGTLAARPAASLRGRLYFVTGDPTPKNNGRLWWDTGATWMLVSANGELTYGALGPLTLESEEEPSSELRAQVQVTLVKTTSGGELAGFVTVGGKVLPTQKRKAADVGDTLYWSFLLPPAGKFKVTSTGGAATVERNWAFV